MIQGFRPTERGLVLVDEVRPERGLGTRQLFRRHAPRPRAVQFPDEEAVQPAYVHVLVRDSVGDQHARAAALVQDERGRLQRGLVVPHHADVEAGRVAPGPQPVTSGTRAPPYSGGEKHGQTTLAYEDETTRNHPRCFFFLRLLSE